MPFDLAKKIAEMLEEIQIINNENDKNIVIDNLIEEDFDYEYERR